MKASVRALAAVLVLVPALAAAQGTHSQSYVPTPTPKLVMGGGVGLSFVPTPTPTHRAGAPQVAPSYTNVPAHAPERLEFGEVWEGDKTVRTFSITSNGKGFLSAEIRGGPFHIVEYREMGLPIRSPNGQKVTLDVKKRIPYDANDNRALGWETEPGLEIQIDVVFNPKFDLFSMPAGEKNSTFSVGGPGPLGGWQLAIPLHGRFRGIRVAATAAVDPREILFVDGTPTADATLTVHALEAISGSVKAVSLPPGISMGDTPVTAGKGLTVKVPLRFGLDWSRIPKDAKARDGQLTLATPAGPLRVDVGFTGLPASVTRDSGYRTDCGTTKAWFFVSATPKSLFFEVEGWNADLFSRSRIWGEADLPGSRIIGNWIVIEPGSVSGPKLEKATTRSPIPPSLDFYARIVRGPVTFKCQTIEVLGPPESQPK